MIPFLNRSKRLNSLSVSQDNKAPIHWFSKNQRYKGNPIKDDLHCSKRIASDFRKEIRSI